jgi:hypothetical protein
MQNFQNNVVGHSFSSQDVSSDEEPPDDTRLHKKEHHEEKEWKNNEPQTQLTINTQTTTQATEIKTSSPVLTSIKGETPQFFIGNEKGCENGFTKDPQGIKTVNYSWVNPKLEARVSKEGSGIFCLQDIPKDEHLVVWTGRILSTEQAIPIMNTNDKHYILQVGDGFYQVPLSEYREPADWTNHSCEPNAGFGKGSPICLSAMRDLKVGDQVCFDYGMCETDERLWDPMDCLCGTPSCRGKITANDWKLYPDLHIRYKGYWSPHVQRMLDAMLPAKPAKAAKVGAIVRAKPKKGGKKRAAGGRKKIRGPRRFRIA